MKLNDAINGLKKRSTRQSGGIDRPRRKKKPINSEKKDVTSIVTIKGKKKGKNKKNLVMKKAPAKKRY